jgi:hypothetical protein
MRAVRTTQMGKETRRKENQVRSSKSLPTQYTDRAAAFNISDNVIESDLDPRLCPSYVYGFSLEKKEWCKFFVDALSAVNWKPQALDFLILPGPQKRLLQGLVTGHKFPERARDEVGLKGKGLVVLLHGTPGSGKTLTAGKLLNP